MATWASYSLSDFLLFSPRVYERLFVLHNADWWPWHLLALGTGAAVFMLCLHPDTGRVRLALAITGLGWMFTGWFFFLGRYEEINWAGGVIGPAALVQGAIMVAMALGLGMRRAANAPTVKSALAAPRVAYLAVLAFAVLAYPSVAAVMGRSPTAGQVIGLTPDPTAAASLAVLMLAASWAAWTRIAAMVVPICWLGLSALTSWTLGWWDFLVPTSLLAILLTAAAISRGRAFRRGPHRA